MAEQQENAGASTVTETSSETTEQPPTEVLKLQKPKNEKKVQWNAGTVDNEFMGKKSSKCCCVYEKPRIFGESSSEDEGEGHNAYCPGHKKKHSHGKHTETPE